MRDAPPLLHASGPGWLALSKPAGLPVFPPHAAPEGDCLLHALLALHPEQGEHDWPAGFAGGLAHRLDIPTSGMVLAATSPAALRWLRALFSEKRLLKHYRLLTARDVPWDTHHIQAPLAHDRRQKRRMVVQRGQSTPHRGAWLPAETWLQRGPLAPSWPGLHAWEARMRTGVMHQIRAHAGFAGLALAGDRLYGGGEAPDGFPAMFALHHCGLAGPGLAPPPLEPPDWWSDSRATAPR